MISLIYRYTVFLIELRKSLILEEKALLLTALVNFYGVRKVARRLNLPHHSQD